MSKRRVTGLILAAGKGTRMKSDLPKCLHQVCGVPMVKLVADSLQAAGADEIVIVVGHGGEEIVKSLGAGYQYAWQREQHGTGHAVQCALAEVGPIDGTVMIVCGDTPLISSEYFREFLCGHINSERVCSLSVAKLPDAHGYGRVEISGGDAKRIIEQKDANDAEKQISTANAGMYCVEGPALSEALATLKNDNAQGEYYLTDIVAYFDATNRPVNAFISKDPAILMGVNDRKQLAEANGLLRKSILEKHMLAGVTIVDPNNTYIGPYVQIEQDTIIEPGTHLIGDTKIGSKTTIGPNTRLVNVQVGSGTLIFLSNADTAVIGSDVKIGPYANIRPKSTLEDGVRIGNFVEINRSTLHEGVKASHLTYIGDAEIGAETNIGAGTITCNFDGFIKSRTQIGSDAFIGSNSTLVAPVVIGDGVIVAAGSVITQDVPAGSGAFGRARQENKEGWAARWREKKRNG
ncbi:MAG: bifunctional UDP-N-acetylglucosamine diphosphorylase/glucosamine-1-phosphate N-acetyltransferase GlmU [Armatimonadetes bacterium]|nr:bifunctional UDP-N-acetylglucosamine diphosphorylase/glucosamine-1-phosphate N-acetyltransferase GlmU [Armatimonadota bacterium]